MDKLHLLGHTIFHDLQGRTGWNGKDRQIDFPGNVAYSRIGLIAQDILGRWVNRVNISLEILTERPRTYKRFRNSSVFLF